MPSDTLPATVLAAATLLALCAALLALGCGGEPPCARNLLLVTVDTLRADHLGVYGYDLPTSPNLDRFAEDAVVFENAYAPSTWTLPSVATLMTSHAPVTHGAERTRSVLDDSFETLAERLAAAGFRTGAVVSHTFLAPRRGFAQGFQHFDESLIAASAKRSQRATSSPQVTARGLAWLDAEAGDGDAPWFLWLHYFDPHHVYEEREGLTDRFGEVDREAMKRPDDADPAAVEAWIEAHRTGARTLYDGEVAFTDRHLGRLFDGLAERDLADDTLVVLGADHGEEFLDHGAVRHRWNLHEATLRVPLLLRAPGLPPRRVEEPVSLMDVAPTVLALLCGAGEAEDLAGTSLVPALRGRPLERPPVVARLHSLDQDVHEAIVTDRWKLIRTEDGVALYDRVADPGEERDVSAEHPERARALEARLDARLAEREQRGEGFDRAQPVRLSPGDRERLRALGYTAPEE